MQLFIPGSYSPWLACGMTLLSGVAYAWMYASYIGQPRTQQAERRIQYLALILLFLSQVSIWQAVWRQVTNTWPGIPIALLTGVILAVGVCPGLQMRQTPELWCRRAARDPKVRLIRWVGYTHCLSVSLLLWVLLDRVAINTQFPWAATLLAWHYAFVMGGMLLCCAVVFYLWVMRRQGRKFEQAMNERTDRVMREYYRNLKDGPDPVATKPSPKPLPWWYYAQFMGMGMGLPLIPYRPEYPEEDDA